MNIWTLAFWKGAGERAIKTAAQTFLAVVGVNTISVGVGLGFGDIPWSQDLSITGVATLLSLVTSLGNASFTAGAQAQAAAAAVQAHTQAVLAQSTAQATLQPPTSVHPDVVAAIFAQAQQNPDTPPAPAGQATSGVSDEAAADEPDEPEKAPAFGGTVPASAPAAAVASSPVSDAGA